MGRGLPMRLLFMNQSRIRNHKASNQEAELVLTDVERAWTEQVNRLIIVWTSKEPPEDQRSRGSCPEGVRNILEFWIMIF